MRVVANKANSTGKGRSALRRPRAKKRPTSLAPYFLELEIENIRCFGPRQTLDFSDGNKCPARWTVILGDNGAGKSTILQCVAGLDRRQTPFKDNTVTLPKLFAELWLLQRIGLQRTGKSVGQFACTVAVKRRLGSPSEVPPVLRWSVEPEGTGASSSSPAIGAELSRDLEGKLFAYGASRRMGGEVLGGNEPSDGTASLFDDEAVLTNAAEWLLEADYAAMKDSRIQKRAKERLDQIKRSLIALLPDVDDIRFRAFEKVTDKPEVQFKTPYGWVPIDGLSLGYKTLIAWMVDFASRLFDRYPDSPDPLAEPAVCLVDEIDLHMHPSWQRKIMGYLSERFPNTQFIVTAHSPLIVQAAEDANIAVLRREGDHVVIDQSIKTVRGWRIDQVLTSDLFDLASARPPNYESLLKERKAILSKSRMTKADQRRVKELEDEIGTLPSGETPEDIEAMDIIRQAAARLRDEEASRG